jgi:hypothetical protein
MNYDTLQANARVVELVDTLALGASASGREGSSPFSRTKFEFFEKIIAYTGDFFLAPTIPKVRSFPNEAVATYQTHHALSAD